MTTTVLAGLFGLMLLFSTARAADFPLVTRSGQVTIVYGPKAPAIDSIAAHLLAQDIERVTGVLPNVGTDLSKVKGGVVVIGNVQSPLVQTLLGNQSKVGLALKGKWESYLLQVISHPTPSITSALVIAGSDPRGTAYGVFTVSEEIGVSPWYWWADVPTVHQQELILHQEEVVAAPPSVKYRGIFLNDEDWCLQPWAAKTFEPETGDIGPKTYAKLFELLLRLKANLIWPAMHPSTKAFYHYPGNQKMAALWSIIIGSSHAEPMLRNNVDEWKVKSMGPFNYLTNKENVQKYWEERVKQSSRFDAIYTLGMRGVHDSGIEGVKTVAQTVPLLEQIFVDQREMLKKYVNQDVTAIPQAFTAYKDVLDVYDGGLKLPDDVTLVWPDDNYGYILRMNNATEQQRPGGSGVYYHASYWGRPHDYLWISTTNPALIREEMMKAYQLKSDRLWVLNVGDLKPLEYNVSLFLEMAYRAKLFLKAGAEQQHLLKWHQQIFGPEKGKMISEVMHSYYRLAFERRPEFMGWSQTEPTTKTGYSAYNPFYFGDETQQRIDRYNALEEKVKTLRKGMDAQLADPFYELVYYPVMGASLMNKKFLYRDKSYLYGKQNRASAADYAAMSLSAYDSIVAETAFYNNRLALGKWKNMMSMEPRDLPVYKAPELPKLAIDSTGLFEVLPEGYVTQDSSLLVRPDQKPALPSFSALTNRSYFIDLFLKGNEGMDWTATTSEKWIRLSGTKGKLETTPGKKDCRIWVSVDWKNAPAKEQQTGSIIVRGAGKQFQIVVNATHPTSPDLQNFKGMVEDNGLISIFATSYSRLTPTASGGWQQLEGLGHAENSLIALPLDAKPVEMKTTPEAIQKSSPCAVYDFYSFTAAAPEVSVFAIPSHPLNRDYSMRFGLSIDVGPVKILDIKTVGRSEEWKQNVLRNNALVKFKAQSIGSGRHTLKVYMIDPGVMLDRILINLAGAPKGYGVVPETNIASAVH